MKVSPTLAPASYNPNQKQSENGTSRINEHVEYGGFTGRHEALVKLVGGRVRRRANKCEGCGSPGPGGWACLGAEGPTTPDQHGEDGLLGHMRRFPHYHDNRMEGVLADPRQQPSDDRFDDAAGVRKGSRVTRSCEDNGHPEQYWEPGLEGGACVRHGRWNQSFGGDGKGFLLPDTNNLRRSVEVNIIGLKC